MDCGFYLYGIFPTPGPEHIDGEGLDRQPVYSYYLDDFTFLYSPAKQEKYLASRRHLLSHEKVLEQAMSAGFRTLLPLRFGMVVKSWEAVKEQLILPYRNQLKELFVKLTGLQEVSVKIFWDDNVELQALMESNPSLKAKRDSLEGKALSMDQIIQIGQMIEVALARRKEIVIDAFRSELNSLAIEVIESAMLREGMIYNAAYLIPWESEPKFGETVEIIDQKFSDRLRIRYNNFTAPYTFAQLS